MDSFRKWFYKPKKDDSSLLAQFFYADEDLNMVTAELDSFDGRKDPERCTSLVNQLRQCQDKVLTICSNLMDELIPGERATRDFRVKFPDDVMQENLAGQLWFGAECLAAGSSIMHRESESAAMRPLAKALIKALENVRVLLREQCFRASANLHNNPLFTDKMLEALKIFDRLFSEFELRYVSAMVQVKTPKEYFHQQMVTVLFSETLQRALKLGLLSQELVDDYDPALMFTIPRLAIVSGLLVYPHGPISLDRSPSDMSEMFRPFRVLLMKIRTLLLTLSKRELTSLEKMLCSCEEPAIEWNCVEEEGGNSQGQGNQLDMSDSSVEDNTQQSAATPPPTPHGFFIHNQMSQGTTAGTEEDGPVISTHSLPDVDHTVSMNIVTEALSSLLADQNPTSPDSGYTDENAQKEAPTTSAASEPSQINQSWQPDAKPSDWCGEKQEEPNQWAKGDESPSSLDLPGSFGYRIRTSTRTPIQNFEYSRRNAERRKRRKLVKTRPTSSAMRVSVTLQYPSQTPRLSRTSSRSSSCSSCVSSDSYSEASTTDLCRRHRQEIDIKQVRAPFSSSEDLIHRLFVCIAGVADQLQSNFAGDLRNILKCVFQINASPSNNDDIRSASPTSSGDSSRVESAEEAWDATRDTDVSPDSGSVTGDASEVVPERPPIWVPDGLAPHCMTCGAVFTLVRRRHHCRNCGKVFCSRCSSNSVPLPRYGHLKPVRVCNRCFLCQVTPFMMQSQPPLPPQPQPLPDPHHILT